MLPLTLIEIVVKSTLLHQAGMISFFNDMSVFQDENHIRRTNRRQAVCHDKARASFHQMLESFLNLQLGTRIDGRRCLIENQHIWLSHHHTRDAE